MDSSYVDLIFRWHHTSIQLRTDMTKENLDSTTRELNNVRYALDQSAIVAITDRAGTIVHVNEKFCKISQYSREELIGKNHRIINSKHHSKDFFAHLWNTISSGKTWEGEIRNRAKDGSYYWVNTTIVPLLDAENKPYQYVSIRYEITQRKVAEESIRSLLDSTFEGIFLHQAKGNIIDVNHVGAQIFGYIPSEIIGTPFLNYLSEETAPLFREVAPTSETLNREVIGKKKDGTLINLELSEKAYQHQGKTVRLTSIRDVTLRKQMEAQILMQDRLASVGLLASSLAHEIGTPLGVIRGRAEYLAIQTHNDPPIKKNVDVIVSQIDRVSHLIRSLLNLARGDQIRSAKEVDLNQIVLEVLNLMTHELNKHSIEIQNLLKSEVLISVKAESQPLHQVLLNLFVNSVHAIESAIRSGRTGPHFICISVETIENYQVLNVRDSGCGISEKNLKNLFKPFFTTKDIGIGTGLGLATSYRIIESWGGKIQVESQVGVGTLFKVFLPKY